MAIFSMSALNWATEDMLVSQETTVSGSFGVGEEQPIVTVINSRPVAANFKMGGIERFYFHVIVLSKGGYLIFLLMSSY